MRCDGVSICGPATFLGEFLQREHAIILNLYPQVGVIYVAHFRPAKYHISSLAKFKGSSSQQVEIETQPLRANLFGA